MAEAAPSVSLLGKRAAADSDDTTAKRPRHNPPPTDRPVRVYVDGIFDLFHIGHARALRQAKNLFPSTWLIVGVPSDELTHSLKGKTVLTDAERYESVSHCRYVDEIVEDAPWYITREFLDKHKIDFVAHGEDPCLDKEGNDVYQFVKDAGQFITIKRTEGISTSDLIMRIVKNYDSYVRRNLSRGYSRKDMNVTFIKEKELKALEKFDQLKSRVNHRVEEMKQKVDQLKHDIDFNVWRKIKHNLLDNYLQVFGGRIEGSETSESDSEHTDSEHTDEEFTDEDSTKKGDDDDE